METNLSWHGFIVKLMYLNTCAKDLILPVSLLPLDAHSPSHAWTTPHHNTQVQMNKHTTFIHSFKSLHYWWWQQSQTSRKYRFCPVSKLSNSPALSVRGRGQHMCEWGQVESLPLHVCSMVADGFKMKTVYALEQPQRDQSIQSA